MTAAAELPARTAHALHALMEAWAAMDGSGPLTAAEVCEYDDPEAALTARHTAAALTHARKRGLASCAPGPDHKWLWLATERGWALRRALEDRFLAETDS